MSAKNNLKISAIILMSSIFLSRVLGFFREMLFARTFGRGIESDAFIAAFTIPDTMFYLLIGGTLSAAFIPVFTSYLAKEDEREGWKVASNFINILLMALLAFTVLGMIFAPYIVPLVAYKFSGERLALTVKLTRIMFPAVAFTCIAGLQAGILNSYNRFAVSALGPVVYNLGLILSLLIMGNNFGIEAIAYGVVFSAFANFLLQFVTLSGKLKFYKLIIDTKQDALMKITKLAIPSILGLSIIQLNAIITQNIASGLDSGTITALRYATQLMLLPVGIFAMGISTAIFPTLTRQVALENTDEYKNTFSLALRTIFFITIPSSVGMVVLSEPIIRLLFASGKFGEHDVQVTAYALLFLAVGIVFQGGVQILTRGFYSIQDTITPVKIGAVTILINLALNILFVKYTNFEIGGLSLTTSLVAIVNMAALFYIFNKKVGGIHGKEIAKTFIISTLASLSMGVIIHTVSRVLVFDISSKVGQLIEISVLAGLGVLVFIVFSLMLKMEEAHYFLNMIKNKLGINKSNG